MTHSWETAVTFFAVYCAVFAGLQAVVTRPIVKDLKAVAESLRRIEEKLDKISR